LSLNLYRITQEAINNAIRHGQAQHLYISLVLDGDILRLSIRDDGVGLSSLEDGHQSTSGMGIKIMQYRAKQLGAKFEILQPNENGTEIRLEMQMT
jgi:signal transduction histidine kinase